LVPIYQSTRENEGRSFEWIWIHLDNIISEDVHQGLDQETIEKLLRGKVIDLAAECLNFASPREDFIARGKAKADSD